ncbi:hypothetical protein Bca4012_051268 [Brassica carinata]|uniref:Uncharacterized protein n=2 Tax=Brassica TaxID=3705 RepID=A0A8S9QEW8_BRACR|nr:hypothetical protein F2Q69_00022523 [Brassica cretica]
MMSVGKCTRVGDVAAEACSSSLSWYDDFTTRCALPAQALVMIQCWNERLGFVAPYSRSRAHIRYIDRRNPLHDLALELVVLTSSSATSGSAHSNSTRADSNHSHCGSSTLHLRQSPSWFLDVNRDTTKSSSSSQASVVVVVELVLRQAAPLLSSSASRSYSAPVSLVVVASSFAAIGIVRIYSSVKLVSSNGDFPVFCKPGP